MNKPSRGQRNEVLEPHQLVANVRFLLLPAHIFITLPLNLRTLKHVLRNDPFLANDRPTPDRHTITGLYNQQKAGGITFHIITFLIHQ